MAQMLRSLEEISTRYTVFEPDQVLTDEQLNGVVDYLEDQERLTRVDLIGVGIVCGLGVSVAGGEVRLSKGVGVTTDGDLLRVQSDAVFDRFKAYGDSAPEYAPFGRGEARLAAWELVRAGEEDERASGLAEFAAQTGRSFQDLVAVLLMESWVKDEDICSGTDCDNLGDKAINDTRLLLIEKSAAGSLKESFDTPDSAGRALDDLVADRVRVAGVNSPGALVTAYRNACNAIHAKLVDALRKVYPACGAFLADLFPSDPASGWVVKLQGIKSDFSDSGSGIQYYYDFLKDLVETYGAFREQLFGDVSVCGPDMQAFPKHLLLGNLVPTADRSENRTGFYPSRRMGAATERLDHARFLLAKLQALIDAFKLPEAGQPIRITPSLFEDRDLEERAIPFYYSPDGSPAIHQSWSYALQRRGMSSFNYSYNAGQWNPKGGAAKPLESQIGRFSFFRVEGHLGAPADSATGFLEAEIKSKNLPFSVRAVLLHADKTKIIKRYPPLYSDLRRLHRLVRFGLAEQIEEAARYGGAFKQQVHSAVDHLEVVEAGKKGILKKVASDQSAALSQSAKTAAGKLRKKGVEFQQDTTWRDDVKKALSATGEFKYGVREVAKTEITTPFDSLVGSLHLQWIDGLADLIKARDDKADEKLLFANFLAQHPGLEHFAGVVRGGTFVLVYNDSGIVVADFMLPYLCCEPEEQEEEEKPISPPIKSDWVFDKGISILPRLDVELDRFWKLRKPEIDQKIEVQKDLFNVFKDSVSVMEKFVGRTTAGPRPGDIVVKDELLDNLMRELNMKAEKAEILRDRVLDPAVKNRKTIEKQLQVAERELAKAVTDTADYVKAAKMDVTEGTDGFKAMTALADNVSKMRSRLAISDAKAGLTQIAGSAGVSKELKTMIKKISGPSRKPRAPQ